MPESDQITGGAASVDFAVGKEPLSPGEIFEEQLASMELEQLPREIQSMEVKSPETSGFISETLSFDTAVETASVPKIFPNPVREQLQLRMPYELNQRLKVYIMNADGQQVRTQYITQQQTNLDVSALPSGVYLLLIEGQVTPWNNRFVKL